MRRRSFDAPAVAPDLTLVSWVWPRRRGRKAGWLRRTPLGVLRRERGLPAPSWIIARRYSTLQKPPAIGPRGRASRLQLWCTACFATPRSLLGASRPVRMYAAAYDLVYLNYTTVYTRCHSYYSRMSNRSKTRLYYAAAVCLLVVAAALRFWDLPGSTIEYDEAVAANNLRVGTLDEVLENTRRHNSSPILYPLVLYAVQKVESSRLSVRVVPAVGYCCVSVLGEMPKHTNATQPTSSRALSQGTEGQSLLWRRERRDDPSMRQASLLGAAFRREDVVLGRSHIAADHADALRGAEWSGVSQGT